MELTRRDAMAALAGSGVLGGGAAAVATRRWDEGGAGGAVGAAGADGAPLPDRERVLETLVAAAEVVYPTAVSGRRAFVETFSGARLDARPEHRAGVRRAVADLDATTRAWYDARFAGLPAARRDVALREAGVHTASERPDGTLAERVRYYVVDEVLYGLFTSPKGGELVGTENPQGHPGGTESYRRGPDAGAGDR